MEPGSTEQLRLSQPRAAMESPLPASAQTPMLTFWRLQFTAFSSD
jgi:hypothetical protein